MLVPIDIFNLSSALIQLLKTLAEVHNMRRNRELDIEFQYIIDEFTIAMEDCYQTFDISKTLKMHILSDHLGDYFRMTGKTLVNQSDEHVEAIHSSY